MNNQHAMGLLLLLAAATVHAIAHQQTMQAVPAATMSQISISPAGGRPAAFHLGAPADNTSFSLQLNKKGEFQLLGYGGKVIMTTSVDLVEFMTPQLKAKTINARDLSIRDVPQWTLYHYDVFTGEEDRMDWKGDWIDFMHCGGVSILCGNCRPKSDEDEEQIYLKKAFDVPQEAQTVRISGTLHFVDDWQGESIYVRVNEEVVWSSSHQNSGLASTTVNVCGDEDFPDQKFAVPLDIIHPVGEDVTEVKVEVGSNVEASTQAFFGLSSLELYIRK